VYKDILQLHTSIFSDTLHVFQEKNMTLALAQHLYHVEAASKHQTDDDICHDNDKGQEW
jgi:hypothetical protein